MCSREGQVIRPQSGTIPICKQADKLAIVRGVKRNVRADPLAAASFGSLFRTASPIKLAAPPLDRRAGNKPARADYQTAGIVTVVKKAVWGVLAQSPLKQRQRKDEL